MSALPKLPEAVRETIRQIAQRRWRLAKEIARLEEEKRALPKWKTVCEQLGVRQKTIQRVIYGEPYRTAHPADAQPTSTEQKSRVG